MSTKLNEERVQRLEEALRLGAVYEHACNYAGITYQTFRTWFKEGEKSRAGKKREFYERIKQAEGDATKHWLQVIQDAAEEGNWPAAAWKLERRYPDNYGRKTRQVVESRNLDISLTDLTDEQLKRIAAGEDLASVLGKEE